MEIGALVETSRGIKFIPSKAHKMGCECFQFFSHSPHGRAAEVLSEKNIEDFRSECVKYNFADYYIHAPYFINISSSNPRIKQDSINILKLKLDEATRLGARYIIVHLGSSKDYSERVISKNVADALEEILDDYRGGVKFLIETVVGSGILIGDNFKQIGEIIRRLSQGNSDKLGVCLDTGHAFAAGYDFRNQRAIDDTLSRFDKEIGLERLKLIHANDTRVELGSKIDKHENIGAGNIGQRGFWGLLHDKRLQKINFIIESYSNLSRDVEIMKELRKLRKFNQ